MSTAVRKKAPAKALVFETADDLVQHLGVPASRIRLKPVPGTATERDAIRVTERDRPCELIDGTLVEKARRARESLLAGYLIEVLGAFVRAHNLGLVLGEGGMVRLVPGKICIPDVSFISWDSLPD